MDGAIHGVRELTAIMGEPPLVVIPYISNDVDIRQGHQAIKHGMIAAASATILFLLYLHFLFQPLDAIFFALLKKLGLS